MAKSICMKSLGFLILVTTMLLVVGCNKTKSWYGNGLYYQSSRELAGLKGDVKMVVDSVFYVHEMFGEIVKGPCWKYEVKKYDEQGRLIYRNYFLVGQGNPTENVLEFSIENEGNKEIYKWEHDGESMISIVRTFNENHLLVREDRFDVNKLLVERHNLTYDKKDRLVSVVVYGQNGKISSKRLMTYNTDNVMTEDFDFAGDEYKLTRYSLSGKLEEHLVYEYDANNDEKRELKSKMVYLNDGSLMEYVYDYSGALEKNKNIWYDDKGNVIKVTTTDNDRDTEDVTQKISYDEAENVIKRVNYLNGVPMFLQETTITYY